MPATWNSAPVRCTSSRGALRTSPTPPTAPRSCCSSRAPPSTPGTPPASSPPRDGSSDHPAVLADRPVLDEAERLVRGQGAVEEEARRHRRRVLGIALHRAAAQPGDEVERALQAGGG